MGKLIAQSADLFDSPIDDLTAGRDLDRLEAVCRRKMAHLSLRRTSSQLAISVL